MTGQHVFISYSSKETEAAVKVCNYLEQNGIKCWMAPRNVLPGGNYPSQIVSAIRSCSALVLMASEKTNASGHVSNEISIAFDDKKTIIPFRLEEFQFTDEYLYFLGRKHWINAYEDFNKGLVTLINTLRPIIQPNENVDTINVAEVIVDNTPIVEEPIVDINNVNTSNDNTVMDRHEIVKLLKEKILKFPYCLADKLDNDFKYEAFKSYALEMFNETLSIYYQGKALATDKDPVDLIVENLTTGSGNCIQVQGLPGCAKNMLLQLAYYKMLALFETGESNYLPIYLSSSYYEKIPYNQSNVKQQMTDIIGKELSEFFTFVKNNKEVQPVLFIEAIREHTVSSIFPESIVNDLWRPFGKFNRITTTDIGLIKNRMRLKRVIPITGDNLGITFRFHSIPISDEASCVKMIDAIFKMYRYDLDPKDTYKVLKRLRFSTIDIFLVRLVAKEILSSYNVADISLTDMYERLALNELNGDEEKMLEISKELYDYVFNESYNVNSSQYNGTLWSLPHKHNTYLEFMVSYYFCNCILNYRESSDTSFIRTAMTSMENHFIISRLTDNYLLQETLLSFVIDKFDSFDLKQKSNATYWLGKLTYQNLMIQAKKLLTDEFEKLLPVVKDNYSNTIENYSNQYLFRSICNGLASFGQTKVLDTYLCLLITNDIANAVNRGALIEYLGDNYQLFAHDAFYLDTDPNIGEQAMRILYSGIEASLMNNTNHFIENDLISFLTFIQSRMHIKKEEMRFDLKSYVEKALNLLKIYHTRPTSIMSDKISYYFLTIEEDLKEYLTANNFDAGVTMYSKLNKLKSVKRTQSVALSIDDPESTAEHSYSSWILAMLFLPEVLSVEGYDKKVILDMLLIHDLSESELGDRVTSLVEPTSQIKNENIVMRKMFLKGTYPNIANLTYYYNVWSDYYEGIGINSRIAKDINLVQTIFNLFEHILEDSQKYSNDYVQKLLKEENKLTTEIGYQLFERLVRKNFESVIKNFERKNNTKTLDELCPECGKPLCERVGPYGSFIGCSGYPLCKYVKKL